MRPTRSCSSRKVERVPFAISAVRSENIGQPGLMSGRKSWQRPSRNLSVALDAHFPGVASRDEDEIKHGQRETNRPPKARAQAKWLNLMPRYKQLTNSRARASNEASPGKIAAAPVANRPTMRKFDPTKARGSRRVARPDISVIVEVATTTNPIHQNGLDKARPGRSGRTILDSIRTMASSGTTATQRYFAHFSERSCTELRS